MKIVVNSRFLTQRITGVQRYAIELSSEFSKRDKDIEFVAPRNLLHHKLANKLYFKKLGFSNATFN